MEAAKLNFHQENPIDQVFIRASNAASPLFKKLGATPNIITTLCVIASALAGMAVVRGKKVEFTLWALLSYFFDCLDGHFARRYNMCSKFGDYYDHLTDWIYYGLLFYTAFWVRGLKDDAQPYSWLIYSAIAVASLGMTWHVGCQESVYAFKRESLPPSSECHYQPPTLSKFVGMCSNPEQNILVSRWFGCGTFIMLVIAIIVFFVR